MSNGDEQEKLLRKLVSNLLKPTIQNVCFTFSLGIALGAGIGHGFNRIPTSTQFYQSESVDYLAYYDRLPPNCSLAEARNNLGPGTEVSRSESTSVVEMEWLNTEGDGLVAVFIDGVLDSKRREWAARAGPS